jgi:hypothetical protein
MAMTRISAPLARGGAALLLVALSFGATGSANAVTAEQRAACTPDALRLCSNEIPDFARVKACMFRNQANLSPRCRAAMLGAGPEHVRPAALDGRGAVPTHRATRVVYIHHHRHVIAARDTDGSFDMGGGIFGNSRFMRSKEAKMAIRAVIVGLGYACSNGQAPPEMCGMLSGGTPTSFSTFGTNSSFGNYGASNYLGALGSMGSLGSFLQ